MRLGHRDLPRVLSNQNASHLAFLIGQKTPFFKSSLPFHYPISLFQLALTVFAFYTAYNRIALLSKFCFPPS